eukprot:gnl/Carplike_NY0171/4170_a5646_248.p1 GENE.gnl/Carplike_NY0171/4170_a5646_248~~gnl/Carplike_NY0171/4170_a5646_248.p1  ORF type:complete len:325 (+),score=59.60 gnl/Carplike_NY0171/4170_a5646_248:61-975(+)
MPDGSHKKLKVDESTTFGDIVDSLCQRIELYSNISSYRIVMEPSQEIMKPENKYLEYISSLPQEEKSAVRCLFKRLFFMDPDEDYCSDPITKHFMYSQFRASVLQGEYFVTIDQALDLAALSFQSTYGPHNPSKHKSGFLGKFISDFIPASYLPSRSISEWEDLLFSAHTKLGMKTKSECEFDYISIIKTLPYHQMVMIDCVYVSAGDVPIKERVYIGIGANGLYVLSFPAMDAKSFVALHEILTWGCSKNTFNIKIPRGDEGDAESHIFETSRPRMLMDMLHGYVQMYLQEIKDAEEEGELEE